MYWKRASSEGANYTVTGLLNCAAGVINAYTGGLSAGNVVDVSSSRGNFAAVGFNDPKGTDPMTVTSPYALVVIGVALGDTSNIDNIGTLFTPAIHQFDEDLDRCGRRAFGSTATGDTCAVAVADGIKIVPGTTGAIGFETPLIPSENVGLAAALIEEPVPAPPGPTRYYMAKKAPAVVLNDSPKGDWVGATHFHVAAWRKASAFLLTRTKSDAGPLDNMQSAGNKHPTAAYPLDRIFSRHITTPLQAQTISGTLDLRMAVQARWQSDADGFIDEVVARYKVHAYVSVGNSLEVRTTILDNYVDTVDWPFAAQTWRGLTAPQTLTSASVLEGDCIVVEIGVQIVSAPEPPLTYPIADYSQLEILGQGATNTDKKDDHAGVPYLTDGVAGSTTLTEVPYLEFSAALLELTPPAGPTNLTPETAKVIDSLPYSESWYDTTNAANSGREVWYKWTAQEGDTKVNIQTYGTTYFAHLAVFTGDLANLDVVASYQSRQFDGENRCQTHAWLFDHFSSTVPVAGQTYYIRVRQNIASNVPASSGGMLRLSMVKWQAAQEDDLFVPANSLVVFRDGVIVNNQPDFAATSPLTSISIDYTKREMDDLNGGTHEDYRVYLGLFDFDLIEILDLNTLNLGETEIDFMGDVWNYSGLLPPLTGTQPATTVITPAGLLYVGWYGNGYLYVAGNAWASRNTVLTAVASPASVGQVRSVDAFNADNQAGSPYPDAAFHAAAPEITTPHHIALGEDGRTLYYTSAGFYLPVGGQIVKRYDVIDDVQLADFASIPLTSGNNPGLKGLEVIPDAAGGGLLVCNATEVVRLDKNGTIVQRYIPTPSNEAQSLVDVKLLASNAAFWVFDETSTALFKFDLASGDQLSYVPTYLWGGQTSQIAIFKPPLAPPVDPVITTEKRSMRWERRGPHLLDEHAHLFFRRFELKMETGIGTNTGQGSDPMVMLRWSDDGGHTWSDPLWAPAGKIGERWRQVVWRRLGKSSDRIFEVSGSDPTIVALIDAWVKVERGTRR